MVRISVIKKGKNNMSDKFNIEGMRVEFEDGLIDKLMQESGIDAVKEITKVLKGEKKMTTKIGDKLAKVNDNYTINMYDNGFMIEVGGRDHDDEWKTAKVIVSSVDELIALVKEVSELPRD